MFRNPTKTNHAAAVAVSGSQIGADVDVPSSEHERLLVKRDRLGVALRVVEQIARVDGSLQVLRIAREDVAIGGQLDLGTGSRD